MYPIGGYMRYTIGDALADNGFSFLEKLHEPIFLIHKNGALKKMNEAARKLLRVGNVHGPKLTELIHSVLNATIESQHVEYCRVSTSRKQIKLITKQLGLSDYFLVEVCR